MEIRLSLILSLCCFWLILAVSVSCSGQSDSLKNPIELLDDLVKYLKAVDQKNRELEKVIHELKEQVKSLNGKFDGLQNQVSSNQIVGDRHNSPSPLSNGPPTTKTKEDEFSALSPKSCSDAMKILPSPFAKNQTIYPHRNRTSVKVLCDFETDGGGWTIIQKRSSEPRQEFYRGWSDYVDGFGSLDRNFWLGLENIRALTKNGDQELQIELEDFKGDKTYGRYSSFSISDASDFYRLSIGGFSGNAGDSMTNSQLSKNNGMKFTTKDKENDEWKEGNCAIRYPGGWWYASDCGWSLLNGLYRENGEAFTIWEGIHWHTWKGGENSLAKTEMKIRTKN